MNETYLIELTPIVTLALEVMCGKYGTGEERKRTLEAMGYDYNRVQSCVNELIDVMERY